MAWSDEHFDHTYVAKWFPERLLTLIVSGGEDRIVSQHLCDDARFEGEHVLRRRIDGRAHLTWIERPDAVRGAFADFAATITAR